MSDLFRYLLLQILGNGAVFLRGFVVIPQYFPSLLQSLFLSFGLCKKYYCNWRNHVRTTKVKVLFCLLLKSCIVPNLTLLQCPECNVLLKSTFSTRLAFFAMSDFLLLTWYVNRLYKSGNQCSNEALNVVGCNPKAMRTLTNSYPNHDCMNSCNNKLCPLSGVPFPKGHLAMEVARANPAS
jgi:hypothetical protein